MAGKTIDIDHLFLEAGLVDGQHPLATKISERFDEWNMYRRKWLEEKSELRNYLFATDTSSTTNKRLPWKNSTTVPKLTQIRDNLHANYLFALFPNSDWLRWEGDDEPDQAASKSTAIQSYIRTKLRQDNAEVTISRLLLDFIDNGNCIAHIEWVDESFENPETGETVQGYIGPRIIRDDMHDIVFNPLAPRFEDSPKITRSLKTLGEVTKMVRDLPDGEYKTNWEKVLSDSLSLRRAAQNIGTNDAIKSEHLQVDGFSSYMNYLESDWIEILTFHGDLYDITTGVFKENHVIEVVDRSFITKDEPNDAWTTHPQFRHAGWRLRPDNLYAMGPLDNLVGMQYRIDHLENLKADVFDFIAFPVQKVSGFVEDYDYEPGAKIYVGDDGDVEFMRPDATALNADIQIAELQNRMEELAGAPRNAMGIRTPGEKTKFEVQQLDNAASRMFLNKVKHFEKVFLEPLLNDMLALARQRMQASDVVRSTASDVDALLFQRVTKDDITANGRLYPRGASHFAQRANTLQNLVQLMGSPVASDPSVQAHLSGKKIAQLIEELSDLEQFDIYGDNIRVIEQQETQQLLNAAQEQLETDAATPAGITEADAQF